MTGALIIESSTPQASVARVDADGRIAQRHFSSDRSHNALLFEPLSELLKQGPRELIELVLVGSGPGSYSGTRVGIAAAQGVSLALQCPSIALPSILAVPSADHGAACLAIGDARRGSYWSTMVHGFQLAHDPLLCDAEALEKAVAAAAEKGIPVIAFEEASRFPVADSLQAIIRTEFPYASRLWTAWQANDAQAQGQWRRQAPQPIYLKPPHITPGKRQRLIQP